MVSNRSPVCVAASLPISATRLSSSGADGTCHGPTSRSGRLDDVADDVLRRAPPVHRGHRELILVAGRAEQPVRVVRPGIRIGGGGGPVEGEDVLELDAEPEKRVAV